MIYVDVEKNTLNLESNAAINVGAKEEEIHASQTPFLKRILTIVYCKSKEDSIECEVIWPKKIEK